MCRHLAIYFAQGQRGHQPALCERVVHPLRLVSRTTGAAFVERALIRTVYYGEATAHLMQVRNRQAARPAPAGEHCRRRLGFRKRAKPGRLPLRRLRAEQYPARGPASVRAGVSARLARHRPRDVSTGV